MFLLAFPMYLELADRAMSRQLMSKKMCDCAVGIESLRRVKLRSLSTFIKVIVLYDAKGGGGGGGGGG